jgi:hypothetical protein
LGSSQSKRVNLDTITQEEMNSWKPGDTLLLNGTIYTGRDAAHKRMVDMLNNGEEFQLILKVNLFTTLALLILYVMKWLVLLVLQLQHVWTSSHVKY